MQTIIIYYNFLCEKANVLLHLHLNDSKNLVSVIHPYHLPGVEINGSPGDRGYHNSPHTTKLSHLGAREKLEPIEIFHLSFVAELSRLHSGAP